MIRGLGASSREGRSELSGASLRLGDRALRLFQRVDARLDLRQLGLRLRGAGEQLLRRGGPEAAARFRDPLELVLDRLQPAGLGFERRQEGAQGRGALADADLGLAQVRRDLAQLGREL